MSFDESGIHPDHRDPIGNLCAQDDVFLFIRPTTQDSMRLIGHGYPTKSTDVHSKSSDWGPMAGFVPCDPAFDKKSGGGAQPKPKLVVAPDADHPAVHHVQLSLTDELAESLFGEYAKIVKLDKSNYRRSGDVYRRAGISTSTRVETTQASDSVIRWCKATATKGNAATAEFALTRGGEGWLVWWVHSPFSDKSELRLVPLYVYAYKVNGRLRAVTGDYDLWLVAPCAQQAGRTHVAATSNHSVHGASAATPYITALINRLNIACGRKDSPVFRHGAEAQNYGFTQGLDEKIAVFTPGGGRYIIRRHDLPRALTEVRNRGYLVYTNKRYTEDDPMLMHKAADASQVRQLKDLRERIRAFSAAKTDYKQASAGAGPQGAVKPALGKLLLKAAQLESASKAQPMFAGNAAPGDNDLFLIKKFQAEFSVWAGRCDDRLIIFRQADFNRDAMVGFDQASEARRQAQKDLENVVRRATTATGAMDLAVVDRALALVDSVVA